MNLESSSLKKIRFIDLFCGIGGFHIACERAAESNLSTVECVFASDIDSDAQKSYGENFQMSVAGDIEQISAEEIPEHDLLCAGFPCQAFSIIGARKGFEDTRGTLFFDIARILKEKKPAMFLLENVKQLSTHDKGRTIRVIMRSLRTLGYSTEMRVLNALNFGLPQKRERTFIVGFLDKNRFERFVWPKYSQSSTFLRRILDDSVPEKFIASQHIQNRRNSSVPDRSGLPVPGIWHENKSGNVSVHPYSCALRAYASYNYLLVNGNRRFTERELLRLQGFPDEYKIVVSTSVMRKQTGNSIPIPVASAVLDNMFQAFNS